MGTTRWRLVTPAPSPSADVARVSHVCTGIMPRHSEFRLHEHADCGFDLFDRLLAGLDDIGDPAIRGEVLAALEAEGRHLDVADLAARHALSDEMAETLQQLAAFGDEGTLIHAFAAVHIARITAGSWLGHCDLTTFILARRQHGRIAYSFQDENGGCRQLGCRDQPLSLLETIVLVDATLVAQAPYPISGGDWRSGYLSDPAMQIQVRSRIFPELQAWYEAAIAEWSAAESR